MTKNNEEKAISSLFDCKKCKLKPEKECLIYERCYKANEYICNLNKKLKAKEQECEELTSKCSQLEESFKETADGLLKIQYALADHCNKYSKTLAEIKPILEYYEDSKIGEKQEDGSYKLGFTPSDIATPFYIKYDPKPAREALRKINEVEDENM